MTVHDRSLMWAGMAGWGIGYMLWVQGDWKQVIGCVLWGYGGMRFSRWLDKRRSVHNG